MYIYIKKLRQFWYVRIFFQLRKECSLNIKIVYTI